MACAGITREGKPCAADVQRESEYCVFHDPAKMETVLEARRAGGKVGKDRYLPDGAPLVVVRTANDVLTLVELAANSVLLGALDSRRGSCIAQLASVALKAIEVGELQERIEKMEEQVSR